MRCCKLHFSPTSFCKSILGEAYFLSLVLLSPTLCGVTLRHPGIEPAPLCYKGSALSTRLSAFPPVARSVYIKLLKLVVKVGEQFRLVFGIRLGEYY